MNALLFRLFSQILVNAYKSYVYPKPTFIQNPEYSLFNIRKILWESILDTTRNLGISLHWNAENSLLTKGNSIISFTKGNRLLQQFPFLFLPLVKLEMPSQWTLRKKQTTHYKPNRFISFLFGCFITPILYSLYYSKVKDQEIVFSFS